MKSRILPLAFTVVAIAGACNSDDVVTPSRQDELVGTWLSAGSDVATGLTSRLRAATVKATFSGDATFSIEITDSTNNVLRYSGTWSAPGDQEGARPITLSVASPSAGIAQGVFRVDGARLILEVVATESVYGFDPPTLAAGFGSTAQGGVALGSMWIQRFWSAESNMIAPPCNPSDSLTVIAKRPCEGNQWTSETAKRGG